MQGDLVRATFSDKNGDKTVKQFREGEFHQIEVSHILAAQRETSEGCAEIVRVYGEIQTNLEAKTACLVIAALLVELGKAKTPQELLENLRKGVRDV